MNFVNTSLFVGDLPKFCTESDLEQFFSTYGPVLDVKIKRNVNTGKTLSYGFVTLSTEALAAEAIRAFDGAMFLGRKMRVRWAMYNAKTQNPINQNVINSVYVRFVTQKMDQYVTEEDLHHVFDPFGGVLDVSIKESSIDVRTNRQSGYGFVHFSCDNMGIESAFQAVAALDNATIDGITFNVELSKNLLKQFNSDGTPIVTPRKEEVSQNSFSMNSGASSATKTLTSPSRSMNSIYQPASFQSTPLRNCYPDAEQTVAGDLTSPFRSNGLGDQVSRTPLRNCSSMNAIKMSPSHYHRSPISSGENTLPRTHSGRMERGLNSTMLSSSPVVSSPHHFALNPPPGIVHSGAGLVGSPVSAMQNKFPSRENSFRSMGGRSASGSFRTLNARSSSANSMTSSYGTTVSCTSSPSPFANIVPIDNSNFDKVQSFRSDPGANRVYGTRTHLGHAFDQSSQLLGQSSHSLSFHESPLSRSLFTMRNAQHGGSDISLLSVPEKATLTDFGSSSYLPQSAFEPSNRPESRASDCSDVSTDSESAVLVLSAKESGLDFFSSNTNESEDFFAFLATGNNSSNKLPLESVMKTAAEVGKALPDSFELSSHSLNLEKMNLSVSAFPPFATEAPTSLSNMLL